LAFHINWDGPVALQHRGGTWPVTAVARTNLPGLGQGPRVQRVACLSSAILCVLGVWVQAHLTGTPPALQRLMLLGRRLEERQLDKRRRIPSANERGRRKKLQASSFTILIQAQPRYQVLRIRLYGGESWDGWRQAAVEPSTRRCLG